MIEIIASEPEWYILPYRIKEARQKAGLSQRAAAELIGYSYKAWQYWEQGKRKMKVPVFEYFLTKTGVSED